MAWVYNVGAWGLIISIIVLVLQISIVIAPRVKTRWARRSRKGLQERLATLEAKQDALKDVPMITEWEDHTLLLIILSTALVLVITILMVTGLLETLRYPESRDDFRNYGLILIVLLLVTVIVAAAMWGYKRGSEYYNRVSPTVRLRQQKEVEDIERRLADWKDR